MFNCNSLISCGIISGSIRGSFQGWGSFRGIGQQLANKRSFPFSEIFRLQGSTLRGIPTFWEISYRELPYHLTSLAPVSVEGFAFGNSIKSGLYRDIPRKFPFHLSSFRFFFFFFDGKRSVQKAVNIQAFFFSLRAHSRTANELLK